MIEIEPAIFRPAGLSGTLAPFNEAQARISPDGHWIAYMSDESGRNDMYVQEISPADGGVVLGDRKWLISEEGAQAWPVLLGGVVVRHGATPLGGAGIRAGVSGALPGGARR